MVWLSRSSSRKPTMKTLLVLSVLLLSGCATNPTSRWAQARSGLTHAQDLVQVARQAGMVSDSEIVRVDIVVQSARTALERAELRLPDGGPEFEEWLRVVEDVTVRLEQLERSKAKVPLADDPNLKPSIFEGNDGNSIFDNSGESDSDGGEGVGDAYRDTEIGWPDYATAA